MSVKNDFDPYLVWLGIPTHRRPPSLYDLLGLNGFESNEALIRERALDRLAYVRKFQMGKSSETALRLISELSQAYDVLTDATRRATYDQQLQVQDGLLIHPILINSQIRPDNHISGSQCLPTSTGGDITASQSGESVRNAPHLVRSMGSSHGRANDNDIKGAETNKSAVIGNGSEFSRSLTYQIGIQSVFRTSHDGAAGLSCRVIKIIHDFRFVILIVGGMFSITILTSFAIDRRGHEQRAIRADNGDQLTAIQDDIVEKPSTPLEQSTIVLRTAPDLKPQQQITREPIQTETNALTGSIHNKRSNILKANEVFASPLFAKHLVRRLSAHTGPVRALALSTDGGTLVSAGDDRLLIVWDAASGEVRHRLQGHTGPILCLALSDDGKQALSGSEDGKVLWWDLATGQPLRTIDVDSPVRSLAWLPELRRMVTGDADNNLILWELAAAAPVRSDTLLGAEVLAVAVSPDGGKVACALADGSVRVRDLPDLSQLRSMRHGSRETGATRSLAFAGDGQRLVSACTDGQVHLLQVAGDLSSFKDEEQLTGHRGPVRCVAVSRDGQLAFSGGGSAAGNGTTTAADFQVRWWDLTTRREKLRLSGHEAPVLAVALSADGQTGFSAGEDQVVFQWNLSPQP